jgi:ADP-heptose:LPS heptosyltransferase
MAFTESGVQESIGAALLQRMEIESVAVFRALQLGDMLCAVPALRALRGALPNARITLVGLPWAQQFASRFSNYIDDFIPFPGHPAFPEQPCREDLIPAFFQAMQARNFDLALQMHGSGQVSNQIIGTFGAAAVAGCAAAGTPADPACFVEYPDYGPEPLRLLKLTEFLGAPTLDTRLEFPITADDRQELRASAVAPDLTAGSYICIHPGARFRDKCWPPQRFAEVADRLADEFGLRVVLTGSAKEADLTAAVAAQMKHEAIDTAVPLSIGAMAALMRDARLLVCNDTGVSHIAAGLGLPSVVVFSKADIQRWAPLDRDLHRCLWDPQGMHTAAVLDHARALLS